MILAMLNRYGVHLAGMEFGCIVSFYARLTPASSNFTDDEAWARFGRDVTRNGHGSSMIGVVRVEQRENGARVPENRSRHRSRTPCLSRAPEQAC